MANSRLIILSTNHIPVSKNSQKILVRKDFKTKFEKNLNY